MAETTDILCDPDTGEVLSKDGDFVCSDVTYQHQGDLLYGQEGEYKQFPTTGVGLFQMLNDEDKTEMARKIRAQFTRDGMRVDAITTGPELRIRAQYR